MTTPSDAALRLGWIHRGATAMIDHYDYAAAGIASAAALRLRLHSLVDDLL
jgi:hypothetical protein